MLSSSHMLLTCSDKHLLALEKFLHEFMGLIQPHNDQSESRFQPPQGIDAPVAQALEAWEQIFLKISKQRQRQAVTSAD